MHDPNASGTDFFVCDYCRKPWAEDRPMVEGHKGSLVCGSCLRVAYAEALLSKQGVMGQRGPVYPSAGEGPWCAMCLERRSELYWASPIHEEALICSRCIRQSATTLSRDADSGWSKPVGVVEPSPDDDDDEHDDH